MTREEAIDRLRKISEKTPIRTNGMDVEALEMAIEALKTATVHITNTGTMNIDMR